MSAHVLSLPEKQDQAASNGFPQPPHSHNNWRQLQRELVPNRAYFK